MYDLENISMATVGVVDSLESNRFFDEACQMIANSIQMFQQGYFDAAFYSLRQSIETSIGTLYLTANPDKMQAWNKLEPGFESGKMANYLRANEPVFMDMVSKMQPFFDRVRRVPMEGRLDVEGSSGVDMSGMGVSFDFIANAQVGFKLYF